MIHKVTDKLVSFSFFSLTDFYNKVDNRTDNNHSKYNIELCSNNKHVDFFGASYQEIMQRKYAWSEGVSKLKELTDMDRVITKQWAKKWCEDDGDEMDMERYYNGMPFLQKRVQVLGTKSRNNRIQKIMINLCEDAGITANQMLWKTYTAVKIVDELESQGIRCEIVLFEASKNIDSSGRGLLIELPVKQASEPINTSLLCSILSPWFLRYWLFLFEYTYIKNVHPGLGKARKLNPSESDENCIIIDSGTALSKRAANDFLKGIERGTMK